MTTVINTPRSSEDSSGMNMIIGFLILLVVAFLFFAYALPAIKNNAAPKQQDSSIDVNVKLPTTQSDTPQDAQPTTPPQPATTQ